MRNLSDLPHELRLLLIYLLDAAKQNLLFGETAVLEEALSAITADEKEDLQEFFPHIKVDYLLSSIHAFIPGLSSKHLAPINFISPRYILQQCPGTKLNPNVISELLIKDLVLRLSYYLANCPDIIRIGIYTAWLKTDPESSAAQLLSNCICQSNAPLLQKLVQMIGDASAASKELQSVKDRIEPMSDHELALVLDDAEVSDLFESFETASVAAGSIGQGHLAKLVDGTDVFVKVKRYQIADLMREEAKLFNTPLEAQDRSGTSPWSQVADQLVKETSFNREVSNQKKLKEQWNLDHNIHIVDIVSHHPEQDATILIMKIAPGSTLGRASIRFPIGLQNAVEVLNAFVRQFYANTLFYEDESAQSSSAFSVGYAPADPHNANQMIHVDERTGEVNLTIIDTASICTITKSQRNQCIDLLIAVMMSDADGIAQVLGIPDHDQAVYLKATSIYRQVLRSDATADTLHSHFMKRLVRIVEATKLVLKRPAMDDLLMFGKAQLQLLDSIAQFAASHAYEMDKLNLKFESLTQIITNQWRLSSGHNEEIYRRVLWAITSGAGRKFKDSFTPWDWQADGRNGQKMWPFGA